MALASSSCVGLIPPLQRPNLASVEVLPTLDHAGSGRLSKDDGLGGWRDLLQGGFIAVVALGLADDDKVGLGQFAQRGDAGRLLVLSERYLGVKDLGRANNPRVEKDMVRSRLDRQRMGRCRAQRLKGQEKGGICVQMLDRQHLSIQMQACACADGCSLCRSDLPRASAISLGQRRFLEECSRATDRQRGRQAGRQTVDRVFWLVWKGAGLFLIPRPGVWLSLLSTGHKFV